MISRFVYTHTHMGGEAFRIIRSSAFNKIAKTKTITVTREATATTLNENKQRVNIFRELNSIQ